MNRDGYTPVPPKFKSNAGIEEGDPNYYRLDDAQYNELLRIGGRARKQALEQATDMFKFDPLKDPKQADEIKKKMSGLNEHINAAAKWAIADNDPTRQSKYRAVLDTFAQTGHTVFNKHPSGRYSLAVKKLNALVAQHKREIEREGN
jgi:hypothetical protein